MKTALAEVQMRIDYAQYHQYFGIFDAKCFGECLLASECRLLDFTMRRATSRFIRAGYALPAFRDNILGLMILLNMGRFHRH